MMVLAMDRGQDRRFSEGVFSKELHPNYLEATQPLRSLQDKITLQEPLIRPKNSFAPHAGRRENGESYLKSSCTVFLKFLRSRPLPKKN